jgi:hypothetical protein
MSVLDATFSFFKTTPTGYMYATLTGTEQNSKLPAGVATASGVQVTYVPATPSTPATITFEVTFVFKTPGPLPSPAKVVLIQNIGGPPKVYSMHINFATPFNCPHVNVDAASGVPHGSDGAQFVTLVLNPTSTRQG